MVYEFAPMEGITDDIFRQLHHKYFPGVARYYTPFLSPATGKVFSKKELREVLPEYNAGIVLVPQLLTARAEQFLAGGQILKDLGYREVNLNLGCPSGTVTAKGKGSGAIFPERRQALEEFLDEIFSRSDLEISIKTRLGKGDPAEFSQLLALYNRYPIKLLTIHPRVQQDLYRKPVRMEWFFRAMAESKNPVALSGGIARPGDLERVFADHTPPEILMLGRGLVADPSLAAKLQNQPGASREVLKAFVDELFQATAERLGSPKSTMFRMKELWSFLILLFDDREKCQKALRKATSLTEYQAAVERIFQLPLRDSADVNWV
jgi:tRNA-dihydrouridine synthase